jgi:membrane protease YdiL (CAAX protease family)
MIPLHRAVAGLRVGPTLLALVGVLLVVGVAGVAGLTSAGAGIGLYRLVMLVMLAPLLEEIVLRAGLQEELLRRGVSARTAILVSAACFGAAHVALRADAWAAAVVIPAAFIGVVYHRERRLGPCVAWHALFNALWLATRLWLPAAAP